MSAHRTLKRLAHLARVGFTTVALFQFSRGAALAEAANEKIETADKLKNEKEHKAQSPIQPVIIIGGENRSFDHVFATYKPKHGQKMDNLLSKGIIKEDVQYGIHHPSGQPAQHR
jgi:phospholipase C